MYELKRLGVKHGVYPRKTTNATMAKAFAGDAFPRIAESAIQVFAGVGFTWEYDIHLYYKRLLTLQHTFGGVSEHLEELAKIAIDGSCPQPGR